MNTCHHSKNDKYLSYIRILHITCISILEVDVSLSCFSLSSSRLFASQSYELVTCQVLKALHVNGYINVISDSRS